MPLSNDLLAQFAKATASTKKEDTETTVYGTVVEYDCKYHVRLDGSDRLTPMSSEISAEPGERVAIRIKNHSATITGNMTTPAARVGKVEEIDGETHVYIDSIEGKTLVYDEGHFNRLVAVEGDFLDLKAEYGEFHEIVTDKIEADEGRFEELEAKTAEIENLDAKYVNIDFANIDKAWFDDFYANSGLIEFVTAGDVTATGRLVGVTISGDLIEGNTIAAEKLVVKGEDGLYYKLNITERGVTAEEYEALDEEEKAALQSGLHGDNIIARTITAEKIDVKDLVAFNATIGGSVIDDGSIHSYAKDSVDNTTEGFYLDSEGQVCIGGTSQYLKFFQDEDGTYKLDIRASNILLGSTGESLEDTLVSIDEKFETLVTDENGESMMTQDGDSWTFNISAIRDSANDALDRTNTLSQTMDKTSAKVDELEKDVDVLHDLSEYVRIGTYDYIDDDGVTQREPCLELGEADSDFKHRITNTQDMYLSGRERKTYIDKDGVTTDNIKVKNDLTVAGKVEVTDDGDDTYVSEVRYVWKVRPNGNFGLVFDGWLG